MSAFLYGDALAPAARRMIERVEARLGEIGVLSARPEVVVVAGVDDPRLAARAGSGPRVVMPALSARTSSAWSAALVRSAAATVVFDPAELAALGDWVGGPVVVAGMPAPPDAPRGRGLDLEGAPAPTVALWRAEGGEPPTDGPGVAWVGGGVLSALTAAAEAWSRARAVVVLPGTPSHDMLRRGGALVARTSLEVVEATRFLCGARPLAQALGDRGRRRLSLWDSLDVVTRRTAEAILIAGMPA